MEEKTDIVSFQINFDTKKGAIGLFGPLQDKIFCLGLIEAAKHALLNQKEEVKPKIERVMDLPEGLKK